jgi:membrane-associated phospholipid phosphatase
VQGSRRETIAAPVPLGVAALSGAGFVFLAIFAGSGQFFGIDRRVQVLVQHAPRPFWDLAMRGVSLMGDNYGLISLMALGAALLWRTRRRWATALPVLMAGTGAIQFLAKWAVNRPRPNQLAWGFPSGHVLSLVVLFGLMGYVLCTSRTRRRWQHLGILGCAATVITVAFSRLYLEAHWFSDVAGGFLIGLAYLLVSIWFVDTLIGSNTRGRLNAAPALVPLAAEAVAVAGLAPAEATAGVE